MSRPPNWKPWTPAQDAKLIKLFKRGLHVAEIAARMKRTYPATAIRIFHLKRAGAIGKGERTGGWGARDQIIADFNSGAGFNKSEIARRNWVSRQRVHQIIGRYGK